MLIVQTKINNLKQPKTNEKNHSFFLNAAD